MPAQLRRGGMMFIDVVPVFRRKPPLELPIGLCGVVSPAGFPEPGRGSTGFGSREPAEPGRLSCAMPPLPMQAIPCVGGQYNRHAGGTQYRPKPRPRLRSRYCRGDVFASAGLVGRDWLGIVGNRGRRGAFDADRFGRQRGGRLGSAGRIPPIHFDRRQRNVAAAGRYHRQGILLDGDRSVRGVGRVVVDAVDIDPRAVDVGETRCPGSCSFAAPRAIICTIRVVASPTRKSGSVRPPQCLQVDGPWPGGTSRRCRWAGVCMVSSIGSERAIDLTAGAHHVAEQAAAKTRTEAPVHIEKRVVAEPATATRHWGQRLFRGASPGVK